MEITSVIHPAECDHDWAHLETRKWTGTGGYNIRFFRVDEFFCRRCLRRREIKREEDSRDTPEWFR